MKKKKIITRKKFFENAKKFKNKISRNTKVQKLANSLMKSSLIKIIGLINIPG